MGCKHQLPVGCHGEGTSSEAGIDRFSDLPEEVAHHVLSFVDFKYLIRVGALSKRCRQFHLYVPIVDFCTDHYEEQTKLHLASLMSSFDRYLHCRGHNRMQRIRIHLSFSTSKNEKKYCDDYSRLLLKWIHNTVRCNYVFVAILHSQSLRSLLISLGIINSDVVEWPSLSFSSNLLYLSLCYVKIVDESLFKWISCCCKYLKELHLRSVKGIKDISVESSSLESFSFINHGDDGPLSGQNLGKFESLEKVEICLEPRKNELGKVLEVLRSICSHKMPSLDILCIAASCAYLAPEKASHFSNAYWKLQNLPCNHQLKELSIKNSYGSNEIEFARYILEHAQNLRKMASCFGNEYWKLRNFAFIHQLKEVSIFSSISQTLKNMVIVHHDENTPSKVAEMVSRSKMISATLVLIRQNLDHIYTISYHGPGDSHSKSDILDSDSGISDRDSKRYF
ncbi:unnamed protein product [Malus baccata var. baccata]